MGKKPADERKSQKPTGVRPRKPVPPLKKPVKLQLIPFVTALATGIFHVATTNLVEATRDADQMAGAVGLKTTPDELAGQLIVSSLVRAIEDIFREQRPFPAEATPPEMTILREALEKELAIAEMEIEQSFFEHPASLPLLQAIGESFQRWMIAHGASAADARNINRRLPSYFTYALHEEWRARPSDYRPLLEALDTPFATARERERAWDRYTARLQRQINEPMFGESFGIVHVHVPLCAYFEEKVDGPPPEEIARGVRARGAREPQVQRVVVDLGAELRAWAKRGARTDAIRVIAGGPGSGKSSFARMFAAQLAADGVRALYEPLHLIDASEPLGAAIGRFVREQGLFPENPLEGSSSEPRIVLLLDGLDELAMQGKASAEAAQKLIAEVQRYALNRNQTETRIQVLLGGRDVVVDMSRADLREPRQVLHLLPYQVSKGEADNYVDPAGLLVEDRRHVWWRHYGLAKGEEHPGMPEVLNRHDLDEITAQPLLGYLVALSFARGKLNFSGGKQVDLNTVYQDLIGAVHDRAYAGNRLPDVRHLSIDQFMQLLEEVALATWHGDGRTTTASAIHACCVRSGLDALLAEFEKGAEAGATRLLAAFYFRQGESRYNGERTFEFTHKSFREYLTARCIVRAIGRIAEEIAERQRRPGRGWGESEALAYWGAFTGPTAVDPYILRFVSGEARAAGPDQSASWQALLAGLVKHLLENGMPMEALKPRLPRYAEEARQSRNAEESLLVCMGAFAAWASEVSPVAWPTRRSLGSWLLRLEGHGDGRGSLAADWLYRIRAPGAILKGANLEGGDLGGADLTGANLVGADLTGANLVGADLQGANVRYANLQSARALYANLQGVNLRGANLQDVDLRSADLRHANISGVDLTRLVLESANFSGANLRDATLDHASLQDATLKDAFLHRAILWGANLTGANLTRAILEGADLTGANLSGANLSGADLTRANFAGANLSGANLTGANLTGAGFTGAGLSGANLSGANLTGANFTRAVSDAATSWPDGFNRLRLARS